MAALLLVVLIGATGLAVDVGASYAKRQEAQNGADAAALAVAQQCAVDNDCTTATLSAAKQGIADDFATGNLRGAPLLSAEGTVDPDARTVTVTVRSEKQNYFMPVLGADATSEVAAEATAQWGEPAGGTAMLPFTFSVCELNKAGPPPTPAVTLYFPKHHPDGTTCTWGPDSNVMPAGFAFVGDSGDCSVYVDPDNAWVRSQTGSDVPSECTAAYFQSMVGEVVLIPVFDSCRTGGSHSPECPQELSLPANANEYHIYGFAAFKLHGYYLNNTYKYSAPCGSPQKCLRGEFVKWVDLEAALEYGEAPDLGASTVILID